jgi:DNA-binding transcriptional ArsR family regulator
MDAIFKALNDPLRRSILDRLRQRDGQSLAELEEGVEMTRFGVMKHLKVLEEAQLITTKKQGRFKYHYLTRSRCRRWPIAGSSRCFKPPPRGGSST